MSDSHGSLRSINDEKRPKKRAVISDDDSDEDPILEVLRANAAPKDLKRRVIESSDEDDGMIRPDDMEEAMNDPKQIRASGPGTDWETFKFQMQAAREKKPEEASKVVYANQLGPREVVVTPDRVDVLMKAISAEVKMSKLYIEGDVEEFIQLMRGGVLKALKREHSVASVLGYMLEEVKDSKYIISQGLFDALKYAVKNAIDVEKKLGREKELD